MSYINKIGKNSSWKKSVLKNLAADLIIYKRVETTPTRAASLVKLVSKLIDWSKINTLHSKRLILRYLVNRKKIKKNKEKVENNNDNILSIISEVAEGYVDRKSGYIRILKLKNRLGDGSLRVVASLV